jgi:hypothetical protein
VPQIEYNDLDFGRSYASLDGRIKYKISLMQFIIY